VHHEGPNLWNAVDKPRGSFGHLTCRDAGLSPVHRPHDHYLLFIKTFSGESERHP
jgi:hypothetical protein